jgi:hypothetical protein
MIVRVEVSRIVLDGGGWASTTGELRAELSAAIVRDLTGVDPSPVTIADAATQCVTAFFDPAGGTT